METSRAVKCDALFVSIVSREFKEKNDRQFF